MAKSEKPITDRGHYTICESTLEIDVEQNVNVLMSKGWKPLGNLLVVVRKEDDQEHLHFIQAMIKD